MTLVKRESALERAVRFDFRILLTPFVVAAVLVPALAPAQSDISSIDTPSHHLTLDDCLRAALEKSLQLKQAEASVTVAEFGVHDAKAVHWPSLFGAIDYVWMDTYPPGAPEPARPYLVLSQTKLNSWENLGRRRTAEFEMYSMQLSFAKSRREVLFNAGRDFFQLLMAQARLESGKSGVEQKQRDVSALEEKFELGTVSEIELLQAKIELSKAIVNQQAAESAVARAQIAVVDITGLPRGSRPLAVEEEGWESIPDHESSRKLALLNSPELGIQKRLLDRMEKLNVLTKRTRYPSFGMQAFYGYNPQVPNFDTNYTVTLTLSQKIFDHGTTRRRIAAADIALQNQEREVEREEERILTQLESLFSELAFINTSVAEAHNQMEEVSRLLEISRRGSDLGAVTFKELLDTEAVALEAEIALAAVMSQRKTIEFMLLVLTGLYDLPSGARAVDHRSAPSHEQQTLDMPADQTAK